MSMIETVARAICGAKGWTDPDEIDSMSKKLAWTEYVEEAKAAIEAILNCDWPELPDGDTRCALTNSDGSDKTDEYGDPMLSFVDEFDIETAAKEMLRQALKDT